MKNKTIGFLFKAPAILVLFAAFIGGIYAAMNKISGIGYGTPIALFIILILYIIGDFVQGKSDSY